MMNSLKKYGVWPVMPTPFTASGQLDRRGCEALIDWYLANRVDGIFTVCLSSEMFDLTAGERLELARLKRNGSGRSGRRPTPEWTPWCCRCRCSSRRNVRHSRSRTGFMP